MKTGLKKAARLTKLFLIIAVIIGAVAVGAYLLFYQGYNSGLPTMFSNKMNIRQELCFHDWSDGTGVCRKCGLRCSHPSFDDNYRCVVCGYQHKHTYVNGVCSECGASCEHKNWTKGVCDDCGYHCTHPEWVDDVCTTCGMFCLHSEYKDGYCVQCGIPCPHTVWENGVCKSCGKVCAHEDHDAKTGICNICGQKVYHDYSKGVCSCGLTPPFVHQKVSEQLLVESQHKGKIVTVTYDSKKYNMDNEAITKNMDIYLPYGYNTQQKYDVLVIMPDAGENHSTWSTKSVTVGTSMTSPRNLYDNMIENMLCRPVIIVSLTTNYYAESGATNSGYKQMIQEIKNDILPFIVRNYSTYAKSDSAKSISEARDHFGIAGFGEGATYALRSGLVENFDLFSNFVCIGGGPETSLYLESINSIDNKSLPIRCLFCGAGTNDAHRLVVYRNYDTLTKGSDWLESGVNSWYVETSGGADVAANFTLLYNALIVLFPQLH